MSTDYYSHSCGNIAWLPQAFKRVKSETVTKCFEKADFSVTVPENNSGSLEPLSYLQTLLNSTVHTGITAADYVSFDDGVQFQLDILSAEEGVAQFLD